MIDKYGYSDWYDFRVAKWGTKWNACDVEMQLEDETEVSISFNTAWSPPLEVIEAIAKKYPFADITLSYYEEGMGVQGEIKNWGECNCEDCGECDCECGCENGTGQTICSDCNENDHQNNNNLPEYTNKEQREEINE
jgi:hypothetical protein